MGRVGAVNVREKRYFLLGALKIDRVWIVSDMKNPRFK